MAQRGTKRGRNGEEDKKRQRPEELRLFAHELKGNMICPYRMWTELPPAGLEGKLLKLPLDSSKFQQKPTLEVEARVPFVSEREHGLIIDLLNPRTYEVPDTTGLGYQLDLPGKGKEEPLAGGFLRNAQHMQNDVHTRIEQFYTGHDSAEKALRRNAPQPATFDEAVQRISATFARAQEPPAHPTNAGVHPVHVSYVYPDPERFAADLTTVVFDEPPWEGDDERPAFLIQHMPSGTPGAASQLEEPAVNLTSKDVFTTYVGKCSVDQAADSLERGDELQLEKVAHGCYVFDNRMANEQKKLAINDDVDVTQLLLVRPAKREGGGREPGCTYYTFQKCPLENMRKHSTFGLGKLQAPEFAKVVSRVPTDTERKQDEEVQTMLAGERKSDVDENAVALENALAAASKLQ